MTSSKRKPLKVVVDTNLFISGLIIKSGYPYKLLSKWKSKSFILVTSKEQRDELIDVLTRPKIVEKYHLSKNEVAATVFLIDTTAVQAPLKGKLPVAVRDPKDEHILAAALGSEADYLVTGDEDLLILNNTQSLGKLRIIAVVEFLTLL